MLIVQDLLHEAGLKPDLILELNVKSRTGDDPLLGSGHWNVGGGIRFVRTIDPAVFFASLGYTVTLEHNDRNPGNQFNYQFGMGFSLNDRVS